MTDSISWDDVMQSSFHMTSHNISDYKSKPFWIVTLPQFFISKRCETPEPAFWARWPSCYHPWLVHSDPRPFFPWLTYLLIFLFWFHSDTHSLSSPVYLLTPVKCLMRYETIGSCAWGAWNNILILLSLFSTILSNGLDYSVLGSRGNKSC